MNKLIEICREAAQASTDFETTNNELKRKYLLYNIKLYNSIVKKVKGNRGSFGTGYPFYALDKNLEGTLPIIDEQLQYNNKLIKAVEKTDRTTWTCAYCLAKYGEKMPDLKQVCKPCLWMEDELKPRKVLNRLPDVDMWMICDSENVETAKKELIKLFAENNISSSDIDPVKTIENVIEIVHQLKSGGGVIPTKTLPMDAHIIEYATIYSLIAQVPEILKKASENKEVPYLPIHPISYRKDWQHDDEPYNFIYDFLSAFTEFDMDLELKKLLDKSRNMVANSYTFEQLYTYLIASAQESNIRRFRTLELKDRFKERIDSWKR